MSIDPRTLVLPIGVLIGLSPAFARDDGQSGDLPCSSLCQAWMDLGKQRAAEAPPVAAVAPPPTVLPPSPKRPSDLRPFKARPVEAMRHVPVNPPVQVAHVVPLPVPRPAAPMLAIPALPEQTIAHRSDDVAAAPVPAPIPPQNEPVVRAVDPEPPSAQMLSPPEPIVASPLVSIVVSTPSAYIPPATVLAPPERPVASGHSVPLRIRMGVWIALALLVGWFFASGERSTSPDIGGRPQMPVRRPSRYARRTATLNAA